MKIREARLSDAAAIARVSIDTWRSAFQNIVPHSVLDGLSYEQQAN